MPTTQLRPVSEYVLMLQQAKGVSEKKSAIASVANSLIDEILLLSKNPSNEEPGFIVEQVNERWKVIVSKMKGLQADGFARLLEIMSKDIYNVWQEWRRRNVRM